MTEPATPAQDDSMPQQIADSGTSTPNWRAIGIGSGIGGPLVVAAIAFFNTQFGELKDRADKADRRNESIALQLNGIQSKLAQMDGTRQREQRELEIRTERLEEWRERVPDGVGLDRWTTTHMELWALRLEKSNKDLTVPDPREISK